ncbi:glycosyltransferase family 2 protein [Lacinutrix gracilariae]|uniref:Glycosyltransferase family 2 protein n=1 Tax=Lacinutrix gracilariae TaxID=1747198 RepID=A0ABW5K1V4_9FLAO
MSKNPLVTVLIPTYNCEAYVKEAVMSILNQTYTNFECIIIDDASTDKTVSVLQSIKDSRIQLIIKPKNSGYTNSLNHGLSIAKGKYIARMDADDISLPERFIKQVSFLESNTNIVACGTNYSIIGSTKKIILPENNEAIKLKLLKETCFGHPTVMLRKSVFDANGLQYDTTKEPAEDYALWVTLLQFGALANIQECLLQYRLHAGQVSVTRRKKQLESKLETRVQLLKYLNANLNAEAYTTVKQVLNKDSLTFKQLKEFVEIKNKLIQSNAVSFFKKDAFAKYLENINTLAVEKYFTNRKQFYPNTFLQYFALRKSSAYQLSLMQILRLVFKSIIFYQVK